MFRALFCLLSTLIVASEAQWGWQNPSMFPGSFGGDRFYPNQLSPRFPYGGGGFPQPYGPAMGGMGSPFGMGAPMGGPGGFNGALHGALRGAMLGGMAGFMGGKK